MISQIRCLHGMAWKLAAALLAGKLIATIAGYGLGGCGGIFSPNLFFGAMCGAVVAGLGGHFLALNEADSVLLIVGGMSACLGAVVQAPVTAILIIFEMTHQFALVPGLMLAGLVSQAIARPLNKLNFYDEILSQDGHDMEHLVPPRDLRSWQNLPISAIANFSPVVIEDFSRPLWRSCSRAILIAISQCAKTGSSEASSGAMRFPLLWSSIARSSSNPLPLAGRAKPFGSRICD